MPMMEASPDQLTLFAEASLDPASPSALRDGDEERRTSDGSGPSSHESFAYFDPASSSWKTYQVCLVEEWETFSETWPPSGIVANGKAFQRPPLVPRTSVTGSFWLPTPALSMGSNTTMRGHGTTYRGRMLTWPTPSASPEKMGWPRKGGTGRDLQAAVRGEMFPTPTQADGMGGPGSSGRDGGPNLRTTVGGQLNPTWVEWLMGFPTGWTALDR